MKRLKRVFCILLALVTALSTVCLAAPGAAAAAAGDGTYTWPVATRYPITCGNYYSSGSWHGATDFGTPVGTSVHAIAGGTVIAAVDQGCTGTHRKSDGACTKGTNCAAYKSKPGSNGSYANYIIIDHGNNVYSLYAHLKTESFRYGVGQYVPQGEQIAQSGNAGNSDGPHLHLEMRIGSNNYSSRQDPQKYLTKVDPPASGSAPSPGCNCSERYAGEYICTTSSANLTIRSGHSSSSGKVGSIPSGARVTVTKASGTSASDWAHVVYNGVSGYASMGYLQPVGGGAHNPEGVLDELTGGTHSVRVRGWAFDRDDLNAALKIHVYVGGIGYEITADCGRPDVHNVHGCGNYHGFDATINVDKSLTGNQKVEIYAINVGGGSNALLYSGYVSIAKASCGCSEAYAGTYICTTSSASLTIRSEHSSSGSKVGSIPSGARVTVTKASGTSASDWAHVEYNGITGYASMEYLRRADEVDARLDHWLSHDKMGEKATQIKAGDWIYLCYRMYDLNTGKNLNEVAPRSYAVTETLYYPDGSVAHSYTYSDSDNNWIGARCSVPGTYICKVEITGEWEATVTEKFQVAENPMRIHTSADSLSLTVEDQKDIKVWTTGYYDGNTSLRWERENTNVSCSWGEWSDGKIPLTVTAKKSGTTKLTLSVIDSETDKVLHSVVVQITVKSKFWNIFFNAGGGVGAPVGQTKEDGTVLVISSEIPVRPGYTFLGWSVIEGATEPQYQPGDTYTGDGEVTFYAVWELGCPGEHSYSYKVTAEPTASASGQLSGSCSLCGELTAVPLPSLNTSDYTYQVRTAAGCETDGVGEYTWKNTDYGTWTFRQTIAKTGHSRIYTVTASPTEAASGVLTGTCGSCGGKTTVTLPALNKTDYTYTEVKAPTYTAEGTGRYTWKDTSRGTFAFDVTLPKRTRQIKNVEISSLPAKITYETGEKLDTTGLTLRLIYSDGSERTVTSGYHTSGFSSVNPGLCTVTVTYEGYSRAFMVNIVEKAAAAAEGKIVVESETAAPGSTVDVVIRVENNPGIASMRLQVTCDEELTLTNVVYNSELPGSTVNPVCGRNPVYLNWVNPLENAEGDWVFAVMTFRVAEDAEPGKMLAVTVSWDPEDIVSITAPGVEETVPFTVENGAVTVSSKLPGDTNGDGKLNNKDAIRLMQYLAGWDVEIVEGTQDINGDGKLNNKDVIRLMQYLADWDVEIT